MTSKATTWNIAWKTGLLFISLAMAAWCLVESWYPALLLLTIAIIYQMIVMYQRQQKMYRELNNFLAAVRSRDFSSHFEVKHAPSELKPLRTGFNEINTAFMQIAREKETQYQYLKKLLELIDTGILSYQADNGTVIWMNESLKSLLRLPYLKTIDRLIQRDEKLYHKIISLKPGESRIVSLKSGDQVLKVLLSATAFKTDQLRFTVVAFQNINEALDETEARAWQKLLGVLTHELMNSIAPISSLAATLKVRLENLEKPSHQLQIYDDLETGMETIQRRSEGLLKFAESYRNLNKITSPVLQPLLISKLLGNIYQLMEPSLAQKNIILELILADQKLMAKLDQALIEQVLINLILNAAMAVQNSSKAKIVISAEQVEKGKLSIKVTDNGCGIPVEIMDSIFVPFFSTKKNGGGIGLPLCKQIVMLHHGQMQFQSVEGMGSCFTILMPS
ncbi:sensor histidine kinase [Pedobacter gandavensis]|uniref:sensor histidine kinase n=1 Tax=Pedobacter gandavensis TaxID=2679963 RepID=UPI00292E2D04|nr:ATP-binding protein [Pedobacter gandavensis]